MDSYDCRLIKKNNSDDKPIYGTLFDDSEKSYFVSENYKIEISSYNDSKYYIDWFTGLYCKSQKLYVSDILEYRKIKFYQVKIESKKPFIIVFHNLNSEGDKFSVDLSKYLINSDDYKHLSDILNNSEIIGNHDITKTHFKSVGRIPTQIILNESLYEHALQSSVNNKNIVEVEHISTTKENVRVYLKFHIKSQKFLMLYPIFVSKETIRYLILDDISIEEWKDFKKTGRIWLNKSHIMFIDEPLSTCFWKKPIYSFSTDYLRYTLNTCRFCAEDKCTKYIQDNICVKCDEDNVIEDIALFDYQKVNKEYENYVCWDNLNSLTSEMLNDLTGDNPYWFIKSCPGTYKIITVEVSYKMYSFLKHLYSNDEETFKQIVSYCKTIYDLKDVSVNVLIGNNSREYIALDTTKYTFLEALDMAFKYSVESMSPELDKHFSSKI